MMSEMNKKEFLLITSKNIKEKYLQNECSKEVARLLKLEPTFDWDMITVIDLSFLNIIHIVGLRLLKNVKHLTLAQNKIKTIENLDSFTKLEHLDLSYNRILNITNIDHMTKLKCLNLASNKISELKNLEKNTQLNTFFINDNNINDINEIFYLKRFKYLKFLYVSNNPATDDARQEIIDQFPYLNYLDAIKVTDQERKSTNKPEDNRSSESVKYLDTQPDVTVLAEAFLYVTDGRQFISYLFKQDNDGKILSQWNTTVRSAFITYKKQMNKHAVYVYNMSLENLKVRDAKYFSFNIVYHKFIRVWTIECRDIIKEYEEIKTLRMESLENFINYEESDDEDLDNKITSNNVTTIENKFDTRYSFISIFEDEIIQMTDRLHIINIYMNKTISVLINKFEKVLEDELKIYLESLIPLFLNMKEIESTYSQVLNENLKNIMNRSDKAIPKEYMTYFENRNAILQAVFKSSEKHNDLLTNREEKFNSDAKKWTKRVINDLRYSEVQRFKMVFEEARNYRERVFSWLHSLLM